MSSEKEPFARFMVKAIAVSAVIGAGAFYLTSRYSIGIDAQEHTCLPWRVFVIDKQDTSVTRGDLYAFSAQKMEPFFPKGTQIVKVADGVPGDLVSVSSEAVTVNGSAVGEGLALSTKLKKPATRYVRQEIVPLDKIWFMGRTLDSFDSRYWGYVDAKDVIGKAYPLW